MLHIPDKRARAKARADKKFSRMYGAGDIGASGGAGGAAAAPRAALYSGRMGTRQRRASKIHKAEGTPEFDAKARRFARAGGEAAGGAAGAAGAASRFGRGPKILINILTVCFCVCVVCAFLYTPAAQCYTQMRERDRLNAEYAAVLERNSALEASVGSLQTDTGIEDRATEQFGMVKEGEQAVSVSGLSGGEVADGDFKSSVVPGSVPAPDTWYSGVLDAIFGYNK